MTSDLKGRIESGDLRFLDGLVLLGTIASQRWFGGTIFPRIGREPYTMMMGPYDFYWFRLRWL